MPLRIRSKNVSLQKKLKRGARLEDGKLMPKRMDIPLPPTYSDKERSLRDEQQVFRVETLMIKGVRSPTHLMQLLDIPDFPAVTRYIERVQARWEMTGNSRFHTRHRGEGLQRLDMIEEQLWGQLDRKGLAVKDRTRTLATLLNVQKQRSEMLGLTPQVIEKITSDDAQAVEFTNAVYAHERMAKLAAKMLELIADKAKDAKVIEHALSQEG